MNSNTLKQYDLIRKQLPAGLIAEDFSQIANCTLNQELFSHPFTQNEIPFSMEGADLTGVGFFPLLKAPQEILADFSVDPKSPLPQLFCYENPNHVYVLTIADGIEVKEAITLRLNDAMDNLALTLLVHMGKNSKATIIEKFEGAYDRLILYNQQIKANSDSHLKIVTLQNLSEDSQLIEFRESQADQSANVHWINFQLGAKTVNGTMIHTANGEYADLNTDLMSRTLEDQKHHFELKNIYKARNGRGQMISRGAAKDKSNLGIQGCITITQKGGGTDAYLKQDSLLLDREARVSSKPALEIDTNDVKAAHGASVSNLNEDALFYLMSRGIDEAEARKVMTQGFLKESLNKIAELPELKAKIEALI